MSRKRQRPKTQISTGNSNQFPVEDFDGMSLHDLEILAKAAPIALRNRIEKSLTSESFEEVVKAQSFLAEQRKYGRKLPQPDIKSILWNPSEIGFTGKGYRDPNNGVTFNTLNRMGDIFIIKAVINTRIEQVQNFLKYSNDDQKPGYKIRYKQTPGVEADVNTKKEMSKEDMRKVEYIVKFLEDGGENDKWECEDNFQEFTRKVLNDSLRLDQLCFEVVRARNFEVKKYRAVDGALIRQLDTNDPRYSQMFEQFRWHGYLPRYAMVWDGQIIRHPVTNEYVAFYPWELGYGIRNKTSNVLRNGYGCSELETLMEIVTWVLWGMQYNGNFFKQGSQPKGFINVKNQNIDGGTLNEFRQEWKQTMSTVYNSHKIPVIQGIDLEWIDLQQTNRDMEFTEWIKFLMVLVCAVYRMDPSELGFQFQDAAKVWGQEGQRERLDHSKQKGLTPLLIFYQNILNKYIISEIDDRLELVFTGIEIEDEATQVDLDKKKSEAGFVSLEDMFEKYSGRKFNPEKDTILNQVYQSAQQAKMMGGDMMNNIADENDETSTGDPEIDAMLNKSVGNPILEKAFSFIDDQLKKK
jgi:phage portal protein|nr:MAG TPA: Portal protein [Caudoviricetes sp.]